MTLILENARVGALWRDNVNVALLDIEYKLVVVRMSHHSGTTTTKKNLQLRPRSASYLKTSLEILFIKFLLILFTYIYEYTLHAHFTYRDRRSFSDKDEYDTRILLEVFTNAYNIVD